jgi:flagellar hook protein FlgE
MAIGSFSASLSGLNANQQKLSVIGNNLANINTLAFKASSVSFADLVSQSVGGASVNPMQIGLGVMTGSISPNFTQGGVENTGVATHVAVQGSGFFVVGGPGERAYTRAGNFGFDSDGMLITTDGKPVQGYMQIDPVTGDVITTGEPTSIVVPPGVLSPPVATTMFNTVTNLDSGAATGATFSASVQVFDALGDSHVASINYTKTGPGAWSYTVTVPGDEVTGGTAGTPFPIATGTVGFNGTGQLTTVNGGPAADVVITSPAWANGAAPTNFTWDIVDAQNVPQLTGFASASATASKSQNGAAAGTIDSIAINSAGEIVASFGAGRTVTIGRLALANFNNPQGLVKLGTNQYGESESSGLANIGTAGTGGRGSLIGSSLEQSNVDLAGEFTQMILAQRGYQANSKSITVADELLLETLNLKR